MKKVKVELHSGVDFAEMAEALGINTDLILTAGIEADGFFVLYTPGLPEDETLWSVRLKRDSSGIFQRDSVPKAHPGAIEELQRKLEEGPDG